MMRRIAFRCFVTTISMSVVASPGWALQSETLGTIQFSTSARSAEAQESFLRGVLLLHSFTFESAEGAFREASRIEPEFAMAYWGEALSHNHPLLPQRDIEAPRQALQRLAPTPEERMAKAPTEREKGFLEAVEILFGEGNEAERALAYSEAMERLATRFPEDPEVKAFYAVSLLGVARHVGDEDFRIRMKAGAIAQEIFRENPDHPGAAHYVIHSFDDPVHAPLALEAAKRYAKIAPDAAHALHMPSHIFIQHGMWDRVVASNDRSYDSAWRLWQRRDSLSETERYYNDVYVWHALDWGQYGDLQKGDYQKARRAIELLKPVAAKSTAPFVRGGVAQMSARYVIETEKWEVSPITEEATTHELLATAIGGARTGEMASAEKAVARLKALYQEKEDSETSGERSRMSINAEELAIMYREAAAVLALAKGQSEEAVELMREATHIEETERELPNGAANPIKPAHELFGEILLELGRPEEARKQFETSLLRMPHRTLSLRGLARAASKGGDVETARRAYARLQEILRDHPNLPTYKEAVGFMTASE